MLGSERILTQTRLSDPGKVCPQRVLRAEIREEAGEVRVGDRRFVLSRSHE